MQIDKKVLETLSVGELKNVINSARDIIDEKTLDDNLINFKNFKKNCKIGDCFKRTSKDKRIIYLDIITDIFDARIDCVTYEIKWGVEKSIQIYSTCINLNCNLELYKRTNIKKHDLDDIYDELDAIIKYQTEKAVNRIIDIII